MTEGDITTNGYESVEEAVRADLRRWGPKVARTSLAALALRGAQQLDDPELKPTPWAMTYAQVRDTLVQLAAIATAHEVPEADELDEVTARREQRRSGSA